LVLLFENKKNSFFHGKEEVFCYDSHPKFGFIMKKDIHPTYREVLFHDPSADKFFLIRSTLETTQTKEWEDGKTYPYYTLDISSASHPFYTGKQKIIDTGGRVQKFEERFGKK
jgi:large subunit ribosomal protein L31